MSIERKEVAVQRFMYTSDDGHKCGAGSLLSVITVLTESKKEDNFIGNQEVIEVLKAGGFVEETGENRYKVVENKKDALVELGNQVSADIGNEMEALPVNTEIVLTPTFKLMQEEFE